MVKTIPQNIPIEFINDAGDLIYPDSDGKRMADNTKQWEWIASIKNNLEAVFAEQADVFVAGDLLWYPVEGSPVTRVAPDVMVAFGRPKGHRGSYKQWVEGGMPPQVVFEILSPGNTVQEMNRKWHFYLQYGVEEYYLYDPDDNDLSVWTRQGNNLLMQSVTPEWISPLMKVRFVPNRDTLLIYTPEGDPFLTYTEQVYAKKEAEIAKEQAEAAKEQAEAAKEQAEAAKEQAEAAKEQAEAAKEQAEAAKEAERQAKESALRQLALERKEETQAITEKEAEILRLKELLKQTGLT
jgi:Uma2 family endonuclease